VLQLYGCNWLKSTLSLLKTRCDHRCNRSLQRLQRQLHRVLTALQVDNGDGSVKLTFSRSVESCRLDAQSGKAGLTDKHTLLRHSSVV